MVCGHMFLSAFALVFCSVDVLVMISHTLYQILLIMKVWGLFAPKFVFEAVGLLVTDSILVLFYALFRPLLK
jgi:hypothetical protein